MCIHSLKAKRSCFVHSAVHCVQQWVKRQANLCPVSVWNVARIDRSRSRRYFAHYAYFCTPKVAQKPPQDLLEDAHVVSRVLHHNNTPRDWRKVRKFISRVTIVHCLTHHSYHAHSNPGRFWRPNHFLVCAVLGRHEKRQKSVARATGNAFAKFVGFWPGYAKSETAFKKDFLVPK